MPGWLDFCQAAGAARVSAPCPRLVSSPLTNVAVILGDGEEMEVICQQNLPAVGAGVGQGIVLFCT